MTTLLDSSNPMSTLQRFAVGYIDNPWRCIVNPPQPTKNHPNYWNNPNHKMDIGNWEHHLGFLAFSDKVKDTKRIAVGWANQPYRQIFNHPNKNQAYWNNENNKMAFGGWNHMTDFWAYD